MRIRHEILINLIPYWLRRGHSGQGYKPKAQVLKPYQEGQTFSIMNDTKHWLSLPELEAF